MIHNISNNPYNNAPIIEAVIDIQFQQADKTPISELRDRCKRLKKEYPSMQELHIQQASFDLKNKQSNIQDKHIGYRLETQNKNFVAQLKTEGLTVSRLAPYQDWNDLKNKTKGLWGNIYPNNNISSFTRIAVRYINRIDIPLPVKDFREYFKTFPEISPDLPNNLSNFVMQLEIPITSIDSSALVTLTIVPPEKEEHVSIVMDIDVSRTNNLPNNFNDMFDVLEKIRTQKNTIFQGCITEKTEELFN